MMAVRWVCVLAFALTAGAAGTAYAGCQEDVSRLMSKDTEKMLSQYNRITRRIEREGLSASLRAEECRIAKLLEPQLAEQIAALKHLSCRREPSAAIMIADILREHEVDLAALRRVILQADCR